MQDALLIFNGPQPWDDFRERLVRMLAHYYRGLADGLSDRPDDQHMLIPMRQLSDDLSGTVEAIYERLGWAVTPDFRQRLAVAERRSKVYTSTHHYSLEQFGLDAREIRKEFAHAFASFDFDVPPGNRRISAQTVA
jgi:hypothetical protein